MAEATKFDQMAASQLESIARCGMCFDMHVAERGISDLLLIAKAAREGGSHVGMIGLVDWSVEDIREIGMAAKGHVTAR